MQIELNDEEANVLKNLLDVAVKAAGLQGAAAALHFVKKVDDAKAEASKPVPSGITAANPETDHVAG